MDLSVRAQEPELMDADDLSPEVYAAVISDLAQANTVTLARPMTLAWLAKATAGMTHFSLVDVGFGHGDMLRAIAKWAQKRGISARLTGVDLNPRSAPVAAAATDPGLDIAYLTGDAMALAGSPDFIISSLVAHHMADAELKAFVRWMDAAAVRGWFINDLHRHWVAWRGFQALSAVAGWHPIVRHDGALSVRRAFVRADWARILDGIEAKVAWHVPFRWGVSGGKCSAR